LGRKFIVQLKTMEHLCFHHQILFRKVIAFTDDPDDISYSQVYSPHLPIWENIF
jgi:hypothetical protein